MKKIYLISLCLFIHSTMFAQDTPLDFKGIALGSAIDVIETDSRFSCKDSESPFADRACILKYTEKETIAGRTITTLSLHYYYGKLESILISLPEDNFSDVVSALTEKYGQSELRKDMIQNKMGATFENRIYTWKKGNAMVEARRFSYKLDMSSITYRTEFAVAEFLRRKKSADKKKAGDL